MSNAGAFLLRWRGQSSGPFSLAELEQKLDAHAIGMSHEVQWQGQWVTLRDFFAAQKPPTVTAPPASPASAENGSNLHLAPRLHSVPAPPSSPDPVPSTLNPHPSTIPDQLSAISYQLSRHPRRLLPFAALGLAAGFVGAHNFYAGQWQRGLVQLLLTSVTLALGFGLIATWLWALAEVALVRKDSTGASMT